MKRVSMASALALLLATSHVAHSADVPAQHQHQHPGPSVAASVPRSMSVDPRTLVSYPDALRVQTLANMRDHLLAVAQIQDQLATGSFDKAGELAEQRLGMSSLTMHGAHEVAPFMPRAMQEAGTAMHRAASQFAIAAKDASATGDLKAPLAALARVSQTCVACHAAFRLQ